MVVSGLPIVFERHAPEVASLAIELLELIKGHVIYHMPSQKIQLRIGLHSGQLGVDFNILMADLKSTTCMQAKLVLLHCVNYYYYICSYFKYINPTQVICKQT